MDATPGRALMLNVITSYGDRHFTHLDIAERVGVSTMTVSRFTLILERLGVLQRIKAKPAHLFVRAYNGGEEAKEYLESLAALDGYMQEQRSA